MKEETTPWGFQLIAHPEYITGPPTERRLVQQSSAILGDDDRAWEQPGSSALFVGDHHHLDREQVGELVKYLQHWLETGRLFDGE